MKNFLITDCTKEIKIKIRIKIRSGSPKNEMNPIP